MPTTPFDSHEFSVKSKDDYHDLYVVGDGEGKNYVVYLPHSCDEWIITDEPDKEHAIEQMREFIQRAKNALEELECKR